MAHTALRVSVAGWVFVVLAGILVLPVAAGQVRAQPERAAPPAQVLVYHQITRFPEDHASVGFPVLSADGSTAVFTDAPGTGDAETPNRIFIINADGSGIQEIDAYRSLCFCGAMVDISADGGTVVSTDSVQVRIAADGSARSLVTLASNEITELVLSGDGQRVVFLVRRDTTTADGTTAIPRGVWSVRASGEDLRQVAGVDAIAGVTGVPVEQMGCCFHAEGHPLDVADGGNQVVFAAFVGDREAVFATDGDSGALRLLRDGFQRVQRLAISADGQTVAYDGLPLAAAANEVAAIPFAGGTPTVFPVPPSPGSDQPLQLSGDGARLLVSPHGLLIDTGTGEAQLLAVAIAGVGGNHEAVLTDGLDRATMDATGERFVYAMRTARCADCLNRAEQLATLELNPGDRSAAPAISEARIEPAVIALNRGSVATVTGTVQAAHPVLGVGFAALLENRVLDVNVAHNTVLHDDGQQGDAVAGDGIYTATGLTHAPIVARDPDTGPRTVRLAAEVEDAQGRRHATAVTVGTLTVVAS